ncbi:MAG: hypothetical protein JNL10_20415 [Verrucomicrobiales bacterium]|nr:hypothetical protein [Verrucomicrobiales bacterium]
MSPIAHLIGSWLLGAATMNQRRDRCLVTFAGVLPDADGLGILVDAAQSMATGQDFIPVNYERFHHLWLHGGPGALAISAALACFSAHRFRVLLGGWVAVHLHLFCDWIGSRGPAIDDLWAIAYGEPLFRHPVWAWTGQWQLNGWENSCVFISLLALALGFTRVHGISFMEVFGSRADAAFSRAIQHWGRPRPDAETPKHPFARGCSSPELHRRRKWNTGALHGTGHPLPPVSRTEALMSCRFGVDRADASGLSPTRRSE